VPRALPRRPQIARRIERMHLVALEQRSPKPIINHALLARRVPIDMELPGEASPSRLMTLINQTRWNRVRKVAIRGAAVCLVLVITLGGLFLSQAYLNMHKVFRGGAGTAAALKPNVNPNLLRGEGSGRVNILLLGRDGAPSKTPDMTDTIIVASLDPINDKLTLLSLPANLWVNAPDGSDMKLQQVWESGVYGYLGTDSSSNANTAALAAGFQAADKSVSQITGLNIDYNAVINMAGLMQAVNTVGGITLNVPSALVDPTVAWQNDHSPVIAPTGTDTLDAKQVSLYVRSLETSSDAARAVRQRAVVTALLSKISSFGILSSPEKVSSLLSTFGNNVATDLSMNNGVRLYNILSNVPAVNISSIDLTTGSSTFINTGNLSGQPIDLPTAGLFNYGAIKQFVTQQLPEPYLLKENARLLILNGTSMPGLATTLSTQLAPMGYNVIGVANAPSQNWSKTTLFDLNPKDKYTLHFLEKRFPHLGKTSQITKSISAYSADFVIIIGSNEANTSQT
jgi:polyisoprenyl-teichoic acid--peptidoglycan teichoic acid transferase